jgi:hypothetical protein
MNKKIGLIIQGPLETFHKKKNEVYNCNKSIEKLLSEFSYLFSEIIFVTWSSEKKKISNKILNLKNLQFKFLEDPGIPKLFSNDISDNRFRQFYSSFKGVESLSDEIDIVLKIRTDLYIDLGKIVNFFMLEHDRKKKLLKSKFLGIICSKRFYITKPYWISDFLYIGDKDILKDFFYSQILFKSERFSSSESSPPERDSVLKFLYYYRNKIKNFNDSKYFPFLPKKLEGSRSVFWQKEFDLWQFSIRQYFSVLPYQITKSAVWKGESYYNFHKGVIYGYKDFLHAETNYIKALKKVSSLSNFTYIILNFKLSYINLNYIKRKLENSRKKKLKFDFFCYLNGYGYFYRRVYFFLLKKIGKHK